MGKKIINKTKMRIKTYIVFSIDYRKNNEILRDAF